MKNNQPPQIQEGKDILAILDSFYITSRDTSAKLGKYTIFYNRYDKKFYTTSRDTGISIGKRLTKIELIQYLKVHNPEYWL